jgi:hypothetical protein
VSRTAAELIRARSVAQQYRQMAHGIDREAREPQFAAMPLTRRVLGQYAVIARRAAIAEELDLDPT